MIRVSDADSHVLRTAVHGARRYGYFGRTGIKRAPLSAVRLVDAGMVGCAFAFLGFFASRLLRCWPLAMFLLQSLEFRRLFSESYIASVR